MRDPARIPIVLEKLNVAWQRYPDLRFGQLVVNLYSQIQTTRENSGSNVDLFGVEDRVFEKILDQVLERGFE